MNKMKVLHPIELRYDAMHITHEENCLTIMLSLKKKPLAEYTFNDIRNGDTANLTGLKGVLTFKHESS